jgi:hypothetical protein
MSKKFVILTTHYRHKPSEFSFRGSKYKWIVVVVCKVPLPYLKAVL